MTAPTGLTAAEVLDRRDRGLVNTMPADTGRSLAQILHANVFTLFNAVVGGSFLLLLVLGSWQDAFFGFFVIANTLIGVVQELRAKRTLSRLTLLNAPRTTVRRDGADVECEVVDVVLDDLLVLNSGDQLTADAKLIDARRLEVDESMLNGEPEPVKAVTGDELLSGSTIVSGYGLARVIRVGADSYAARITAEAKQFSLVNSELRRSIARVIRWVTIALFPVGAIVVNGQMQAAGGWSAALSNGAWHEAVVVAVGAIIATVPQGLVFMTSIAFAVGAVRLARSRVLVQELAAVEGLARVDMLCVDKTGTLTEGAMALDRVELVADPAPGWDHALAWFASDPGGNATTKAIGSKFRADITAPATPDEVVPFSSRHKWSAAYFSDQTLPGSWVLGAAEMVLTGPDAATGNVLARAISLSTSGNRVLVLAHSAVRVESPRDGELPILPPGVEPVGVIVLRDRIRGDAAETIRYFQEQGVQVCVISGDSPRAVTAIASEVGIDDSDAGVDARFLPADPDALAELARTQRVFGRVTPEQKKALVFAFQSLGYTVAMTGDGVNDALALKHADLGIAMGSGSAAARTVADIVLLDGAFARLPGVVAEGRKVIANVERLAKLFLSKTVYAVVLAVAFGALLWPYPFLPRQLSVVDGLTIGLPALILALLPNARIYRPGFLRRAAWFCVPSGLIVAGAVIGVAAYAYVRVGSSTAEVQTIAVISLAVSALWVLVVLVRPLTRTTTAILFAAYAGLLLVLSFPWSRDFLMLELPPVEVILVALGVAVVASLILEVVHRMIRH